MPSKSFQTEKATGRSCMLCCFSLNFMAFTSLLYSTSSGMEDSRIFCRFRGFYWKSSWVLFTFLDILSGSTERVRVAYLCCCITSMSLSTLLTLFLSTFSSSSSPSSSNIVPVLCVTILSYLYGVLPLLSLVLELSSLLIALTSSITNIVCLLSIEPWEL